MKNISKKRVLVFICILSTISILLSFISTGCDKVKDEKIVYLDISEFSATKDFSKPDTSIKVEGILFPLNIYSVDSIYLISNYRGAEYFFDVYNKSFIKIGSFGRRGLGPGEFQNLKFKNQFILTEANKIKLWVYDGILFEGYFIDLKKAIEDPNSDDFIEQKVTLPIFVQTIPEYFFLKENGTEGIGRSDMYSEGRYFLNKDGTDLKWFDKIPNVKPFTHPENLKLAYHASSAYSKYSNKLYSAMTFFPRIDIYDRTGLIEKTLFFEENYIQPDFSSYGNPFNPGNYDYFYDIELHSKGFFVLYVGEKRSDLQNPQNNIKSTILAFDLAGNPKYKVKFPVLFYSFAYDEQTNEIITIDRNSEEVIFNFWKL